MAAQELIFGFKFIGRTVDNRFQYGTPENTIPVFKNSPSSSYDDNIRFINIKQFADLKSDTPSFIYIPSIDRSPFVPGTGEGTKGYIVNLSEWKPNIYDEDNKAYYMLDYVSYLDTEGKEINTKTNSIVAHYKMFVPLYYKEKDSDALTLVPTIEARNISTSIGTYSITGVDKRTDSAVDTEIDKAYLKPIFSNNMFRFVDGDNLYYSNYSFTAAEDYVASYNEIVQWLRSISIKTVKSGNKITVNVSIPSVYRQIWVSKSSDPISAEKVAARYKLFLIRNTPGKKTSKKTIDNEKITILHSYIVTGTRWSHPKPSNKEKYVFTYPFSAQEQSDFSYTFDLTNILEQEYKTTDSDFYLKHCADTGLWRTSKELDHSQWIFSVVLVLETNYRYEGNQTYTLLNKTDTGYAAAATDVPWAKRCTKIDYSSRCLFDVVK